MGGEQTGFAISAVASATVSQPETPVRTSQSPERLSFEFVGSTKDYFRVWIVNLLLTLVTFGVFSAWAKVRKKRFIYAHTLLDGTPFQYTAKPIPILKGRILAATLFIAYYLTSNVFTVALPYVLIIGAFVLPWIIVRSAAFNCRYSAFRNLTPSFDGTYFDALKVAFLMPAIPAFIAMTLLQSHLDISDHKDTIILGLIALAFSVFVPFWFRDQKKLVTTHTLLGEQRGNFTVSHRAIFNSYAAAGLLAFAPILAFTVFGILFSAMGNPYFLIGFGTVMAFFGYLTGIAFLQAKLGNLIWMNVSFGGLFFRPALRARDMWWLYLSNGVAIIASLGLLVPWAVVRMLRYRASRLNPILEGEWTVFSGGANATVAAAGAEAGDIFDLDFSL